MRPSNHLKALKRYSAVGWRNEIIADIAIQEGWKEQVATATCFDSTAEIRAFPVQIFSHTLAMSLLAG
jgi:hypothetical protein